MAQAPSHPSAAPRASALVPAGLAADEALRLAGQLTLKQLRACAAVAQDGSLTLAAQRLFVSQPAASALVRGLEQALGLKLLDRSTRRLALTSVGAGLLPAVQRLLDDLTRLAGEARDLAQRRRGRVLLGSTPLLGASLLPPMMAAYCQVASALALAAAGLGLAIVPAYALRVAGLPALASVPLIQPAVRREVLLVHLAARSLSPAALAMHQHLIQQFGGLQPADLARPPRRRKPA